MVRELFLGVVAVSSLGFAQARVAETNLTPQDTQSASPGRVVQFGAKLCFPATTTAHGRELWCSDGTREGTAEVIDLVPGTTGADPSDLAVLGTKLLFAATTAATGRELFITDGTAAGTSLLKDIYAGTASSSPGELTTWSGLVLFAATTGASGRELWRTDGTAAGTVMIQDIGWTLNGTTSSNPRHFFTNGSPGMGVYFIVDGPQLWRTDGYDMGTYAVSSFIYPDDTRPFVNVGNSVYFVGGGDLYVTQGSYSNTTRLTTLPTGGTAPGVTALGVLGTSVYFAANNGTVGAELWKTDGTVANTALLKDLRTGAVGSEPRELISDGTTLFFTADDGVNGRELWKSDGTAVGTTMIKAVTPGTSTPASTLTVFGGALFFTADDGGHGVEWWKSDGTAANTVLFHDLQVGAATTQISSPQVFGSTLYFVANVSASGLELWKTDGVARPTLVADVNQDNFGETTPKPVAVGSTLFFVNNDGETGAELWKSDGTQAGTQLLKDIRPGPDGANIGALVAAGSLVFFTAQDAATGLELWRSDGTPVGTVRVADLAAGSASSEPRELIAVGSTLFFHVMDGTNYDSLYRVDGTGAPVRLVALSTLTSFRVTIDPGVMGNTLYFRGESSTAGYEPWRSDGTVAGTVMLKDTRPGTAACYPGHFIAVGTTLFFLCVPESALKELWRTDGTAAGTTMVADISPFNPAYFPEEFMAVGTQLLFSNHTSAAGMELWRSDGTAANTGLLMDIYPGANFSLARPARGFRLGNVLLFPAEDGVLGREPWRTDGTLAGTQLLKDVRVGAGQSLPYGNLSGDVIGGTAYFLAWDSPTNGQTLWSSDGTPAGTSFVARIPQWAKYNDEGSNFAIAAGSRLFFTSTTLRGALELWSYAPGPVDSTPPVITPVVTGTQGQNGWYVGTVSVSFTVSDAQSAISSSTGCGAVMVTSDTSGQTFTCSATSGGGTAMQSVTIKRDATAPMVSCPMNVVTSTMSMGGAVVTFSPTAMDALSTPTVVATPASGSTFAVGSTTVAVSATDAAGNVANCSFTVQVNLVAVDAGRPDSGIDAGPSVDAGPVADAGQDVDAGPVADAGSSVDAGPTSDGGVFENPFADAGLTPPEPTTGCGCSDVSGAPIAFLFLGFLARRRRGAR
jgi:ELWxxDGT repeat protein